MLPLTTAQLLPHEASAPPSQPTPNATDDEVSDRAGFEDALDSAEFEDDVGQAVDRDDGDAAAPAPEPEPAPARPEPVNTTDADGVATPKTASNGFALAFSMAETTEVPLTQPGHDARSGEQAVARTPSSTPTGATSTTDAPAPKVALSAGTPAATPTVETQEPVTRTAQGAPERAAPAATSSNVASDERSTQVSSVTTQPSATVNPRPAESTTAPSPHASATGTGTQVPTHASGATGDSNVTSDRQQDGRPASEQTLGHTAERSTMNAAATTRSPEAATAKETSATSGTNAVASSTPSMTAAAAGDASTPAPLDGASTPATATATSPTAATRPVNGTGTPATPTSEGRPIEMPDAANLLEQVRVRLSPRRPEITVLLDPPELGRLFIKLAMKGGELAATVTADDARVARVFEGDVGRLYRTLDDAGIRVSEVEIRTGLGSTDDAEARWDEQRADAGSESGERNDPADTRDVRKSSQLPSSQAQTSQTIATSRASTLDVMI